MKKILIFMMVFCLIFSMSACGKPSDTVDPDAEVEFLVVLITDKNGLGDEGLNDSCWRGLQNATMELGVNVDFVTPKNGYADAIKEAVEMHPDLIICPHQETADVLAAVAGEYVDQLFVTFDAELPDNFNVTTAIFNKEERGFLAGAIAALCNKSKVVGFIGFSDVESTASFQYGFTGGVVSTDKTVYISTNNVKSDIGSKGVKQTAVAQCKLGADILFHVVGRNGTSVLDAADERNFKVISLSVNESMQMPDSVLCIIAQNGEKIIYDIVKRLVEGTFDGSNINYGISDDAFVIYNNAENISEENLLRIEEIQQAIKDKEIVVPYDSASYQSFMNGGQTTDDSDIGIINENPEMDIQ